MLYGQFNIFRYFSHTIFSRPFTASTAAAHQEQTGHTILID
jgi:hypothetical protein